MSTARIDSKEGLDAASGGASVGAQVGVKRRADDGVVATADGRSASRTSWAHVAVRVVRNATIGLALLATIPLGLVANRSIAFVPNMSHLVERTAEADRWRDFRAPIDASITPQAAGDALRRITAVPAQDGYRMRAVAVEHARPWSSIALAPDLFPNMRTPQSKSPAAFMLIAKTLDGYSSREMAYLREIAEAPLWKDFDAVASAARVDVVGGLYETPFATDAQLMAFPTVGYADAKQIAYAAVARATYHLASGDPAEAERILRTTVSFGFTFIDQGVTALDAMVGRMVVDIARDGLYHLYLQSGRGELADRVAPLPPRTATGPRAMTPAVDEQTARARTLTLINDARIPRPLRMEALEVLSYSGSCGGVRAMLTGPSDELRRTLTTARASMARFPSEQAFFDLIERNMHSGPQTSRDAGVLGRVASGTAAILSAVTGNSRIATCTRLASTISPRE
ncbi:hypothetical protein [Gemmatimonas sp.]|uniref:hypothetical protein n=1 Tax=Gemmatimonas sp. TaxID=1962908 RepID=UPI00286C40A3|nr:hypothetical protein [Gemmatimonas sp.]